MSKFWLYTLNPCVFTKFGFIAHMLLLIAHVLLLTAHRSLLVAHKIASLQPQPHMRKQHPSLHCPRMWNFNMPLQLKVVTLTSLAHAFYHHYSQQNAHKRSGCNRVNSTYAPSSQLVSLIRKYTSITTILDNGANKHLIMVEF